MAAEKRILLIGGSGQLGRELAGLRWPEGFVLVAPGRKEADITDRASIARLIAEGPWTAAINCAAWTAVDAAETAVADAFAANALGPAILAEATGRRRIPLVHLSTDYVFDGAKPSPYEEDDPAHPLGVYGASKLAGEEAVRTGNPRHLIVRTAWLYGRFGRNFVKTMLRLMGERDVLGVVTDQVGTPTWAHGLAEAVWAAAARPQLRGIYHWSDAGVCSWYDFAVAIYEEAQALGLLSKPVKIRPILAVEYPTPAQRPAYSVLDKATSWRDLQLAGVHWRRQLRRMLADLKELPDG